MMNVYMMKHLMEIDEWVSSREGYSYSMSVNKWGTEFWVYNRKTDVGQSVKSVSELNEDKLNKLESEKVCEKLEVQR